MSFNYYILYCLKKQIINKEKYKEKYKKIKEIFIYKLIFTNIFIYVINLNSFIKSNLVIIFAKIQKNQKCKEQSK